MNTWDWTSAPLGNWNPEEYILAYWHYVQGFVVNKYSGYSRRYNQVHVDDLCGVAVETLVRFAREGYPDWVERNQASPHNPKLFWSLLRGQVNWAVLAWVDDVADENDPLEGADDEFNSAWMRTQMGRYREPDFTIPLIIDRFRAMDTGLRAALALFYFEELSVQEITSAMALESKSWVDRSLKRGRETLLHHALVVVSGVDEPSHRSPIPWPEEAFESWTRRTYGASAEDYLEHVATCWTVDVSYLCAALYGAQDGARSRHPGTRSARAKLTDDQVREIRARIASGESQASIGQDLGVSQSIVSRANSGACYRDVA
ncbi:MAG: hypothetical protein U1C73_15895 [Dietzia sp.]|nr:hypothetical protein [Dietzia sp.]